MVSTALNPGSASGSAISAKPRSALPKGWRIHRPHNQRLTVLLNSAVAAAIVLALVAGVWGYTGGFDGTGGGGQKNGQFAALPAQDSTPEASPMAEPADTSHLVMAQPRKLTAADCTVQPRTREELIALITTGYSKWAGTKSKDYPAVRDQYSDGMKKEITQADFDQLQAAADQWRACSAYGTFWQWAAVTSDFAFLSEIYFMHPAGNLIQIDAPYSAEMAAEIVDKWEEAFFPSDILSEAGTPDSIDSMPIDPSTFQMWGQEYLISTECALQVEREVGTITFHARFFFEAGVWRMAEFRGDGE